MLRRIMSHDVTKVAAAFAVPAALFAAAWPLLHGLERVSEVAEGGAQAVPYGILALGTALALWFHKSRAVFALLAVAIAHFAVAGHAVPGAGTAPEARVVYAALATLLPINLLAFTMMGERGVLTERGGSRFSLMAFQVGAVAALATTSYWLEPTTASGLQQRVMAVLSWRPLPAGADGWTPLPQLALILFALAFAATVVRAALNRAAPLETAFAGTVAATGLALHLAGKGHGSSVFFAVAGLMILVAVVQESYRMAFLDELTGLPGRRALLTELGKLGDRYCLAMLDVDHFKKFNDTYGHDVGDQVLRMVAGCLARVGGGGKSFRYGGEEFTVVFPGKQKGEALPHLDALRLAVEAASFTLRGPDRPEEPPAHPPHSDAPRQTVSVTISIGVAEPGAGGDTPDEVMKLADQALYRAKDGGRNRVAT